MFFRNELVIKEMKEYSDEIKQYRLKADRLEVYICLSYNLQLNL